MDSSPPTPPKTAKRRDTRPIARARLWPWFAGVALLLLIGAGLWPKATPVETAHVTRGDLVVTVSEEGMTRVRNRYVVSTPVAGQLRRIDWKAGAIVEAGKTPLAIIEAMGADFLDTRSRARAEAAVRAAEAGVHAAAAQRERAQAAARMFAADFERLERLRASGAISIQEFDVAQMRTVSAQQEERAAAFALRVAEFELEQARAVLLRGANNEEDRVAPSTEPLVIKSPVNGRILRVLQESARVVPAGFALMEVGDPTDLEARIEVLSAMESQSGQVPEFGSSNGVARCHSKRACDGWNRRRLRRFPPSAWRNSACMSSLTFVDPVENRPTLGDNYRVEGRVVVWEGRDVLRAPAGALFQRGGAWQTFVIENGRARLRTISVGRTDGHQTEVLDGLEEGDVVIVYPGDRVADGARVRELAVAGEK